MYIKTKIPVTYNKGVKGTASAIAIGVIESVSWMNDFTQVGVNYNYQTEDGVIFNQGGFTVESDNIELMYNAVLPLIITDGSHKDSVRSKFYLGFMIEMADVFGVSLSDIELLS